MLEIESLSVSFGRRRILEDVSLCLEPRQVTVLLGRNGSGKSTLISCLTGGVAYRGSILLNDHQLSRLPARERAKQLAVLPQLLPKVSFTVRELVSMGRNPYLDLGRHLTAEDEKKIDQAIAWAGLEDMQSKRMDQLSGGERQKAYLAMTLAQDTEIVAFDEPTTYLDLTSESEFYELIMTLKIRYQKTILIVMHDLTRAMQLADKVAVLEHGRLQYYRSAQDCIESRCIERIFSVKRKEAYVYYVKEDL